ncbi:MAG TPA: hypothetical protein VF092_14020 [Longimicrobium sp.]
MKRIHRGIFAAVLAGALGFGGARAFASTAAPAPASRACHPQGCNASCEARFGPFASGQCMGGECFCAV